MIRALLPCPLLFLCAACASSGGRAENSAASAEERALEASAVAEDPALDNGAGTQAASAPRTPAVEGSDSQLANDDLELWNDPDFRRRFTESYLAETETEPGVSELEREEMQEVLKRISAGRLDQALALLEKRRGEAASAVLDFTAANIHFQRDEFEQAVAGYQVAVRKFPRFRRAWGNLGLCHARLGNLREASQAFTRVVEQGGGNAATYGLLGIAHSSLGDHLSAESAFRMAALLDPASKDWKKGLAESLFKQERFADAAALCGSLIEAEPERAELWLLQANAYARLERPLDAAQNLELVDHLGKSTADSLYLLGDIYTNEELFDLAAATYLSALVKDSGARPGRAIRAAQGLGVRGAHAEAARVVEDVQSRCAERLGPDEQRELLHLRVRIAVATGAGEEELHALEEIVALDPLDGDALLLLGQNANRSGDPEKAIFYYERAAQLEAFEADAKVRHGQLLVNQGKYAEALPLLRRAQTLKPRDNVQDYLEQVERVAQGR